MYRILLDLHLKLPYFSTIFLLAQSSIKICTFLGFISTGYSLIVFSFNQTLNYFGKTKEEEKKPIFKTFTR
jgi:hypothetical protein